MPNKKSAIKRVQIAERNRLRNHAYKSAARTALKKVRNLISSNAETEVVCQAYQKAQSLLDRAVLKGIYSKNKASRDKARLSKAMRKKQAEPAQSA